MIDGKLDSQWAYELSQHIDIVPSGCWLMTSAPERNGYVKFGKHSVHRLSFRVFTGATSEALHNRVVRHSCDVRHCINPAHLSLGSAADNSRDMVERGRSKRTGAFNRAKTHCPRGHEYTSENTRMYRTSRHCLACVKIRRSQRSDH